jgi:hypothetical protein
MHIADVQLLSNSEEALVVLRFHDEKFDQREQIRMVSSLKAKDGSVAA